jgi:hypothetical protein
VIGTDSGYSRIISRSSGKAIDVLNQTTANGGEVVQWGWNGGANQQWQLVPVSTLP